MRGGNLTAQPGIQGLVRRQVGVGRLNPLSNDIVKTLVFCQLDAEADGVPQALAVKGLFEVAVIQGWLDPGVGRGQP